MAIIFFTARHFDGSGDIVHTVKIADFLQKQLRKNGYTDNIIIVVPDLMEGSKGVNHKEITDRFVAAFNPLIKVQTMSMFKKSDLKVDCYIEAALLNRSSFNKEDEQMIDILRNATDVPYIFMPEYGNDLTPQGKIKIPSGFNKKNRGEVGVFPNQKLLDATQDTIISQKVIKEAFDELDHKIKRYLAPQTGSSDEYLQYRETHGLSYQYSHEHIKDYVSYIKVNGQDVLDLTKRAPIDFFLSEHIVFSETSGLSQDIICLGDDIECKKNALRRAIPELTKSGYTDIVFLNMDNGEEEALYSNVSSQKSKCYRVLYSASLPFTTMQSLPLLSDDLVGTTGDNSFVEAMSAGKLISYECASHKKEFAFGYLGRVKEMATNPSVYLLAEQLMKIPSGIRLVPHNQELLKQLLQDKAITAELKNINRTLIATSNYLQHIEVAVAKNIAGFVSPALFQIEFEQLLDKLKIKTDQLIEKGTKGRACYNPKYRGVSKAANELYNALQKSSYDFFTKNSAEPSAFKQFDDAVKDAITKSKKEMQIHRGIWGKLSPEVKAVLGILAAIAVIPAVIVAIKSPHSYYNTFFGKRITDSAKELGSFEKGADDLFKKNKPGGL